MKEKVLQAMREYGQPVNAGKIAEITGIDRKDVDKAFAELKKEGAISLKVYLDSCKENGFKPFKSWSGKFNVRLTPEMHQLAVAEAASAGISLNELVKNAMAAYLQPAH